MQSYLSSFRGSVADRSLISIGAGEACSVHHASSLERQVKEEEMSLSRVGTLECSMTTSLP